MSFKPFSDKTTNDIIERQKRSLISKIDCLSNEEIMANDIEILAENLYQEFFIEPVKIFDEDFSKRSIKQGKVSKYVEPFDRDFNHLDRDYVDYDGVIARFYFPFIGEEELFKCSALTFSVSPYPQIEIKKGEIVFEIRKTIDEVKHISKDKMFEGLQKSLDSIKEGISFANRDIEDFNSNLKLFVWKKLNEKKSKVGTFFEFAQKLEVPIEKKEYAQNHISIQRRIVPIAKSYDKEPFYGINDNDYVDILLTIKHTLSTYERTPHSYKSLKEEELRDTLLAALNATYKGDATGETFRNKGKTDICIERENRAAFVAECKMWSGEKKVGEAIVQLDSYLTWRDCKVALIYFVRKKNFFNVLDRAKETLKSLDGMKSVKETDKNEFECFFVSKSNPGQYIKIRVMLFNLFCDEFE